MAIDINELVALIVAGGQLALDVFLKTSALANLGPDIQQNILNLVKAANDTDDQTIARADAWLKENFPNG